MNLLRTCLTALTFIGIAFAGYGQEKKDTLKLSVVEAQNYAIENNRTVKSAKIDIEIAKKKVWEITATGLPQFSATADYQHLFKVPVADFGGQSVELGVANNTTFNFTLSQLVFSGEYLVGLQASKVYKELSDKSYIKSEQTIKESVATSYYLVLVAEENLRVLNESLKAVDQIYLEISKMNQQGFNEETDVDQMKINKSNLMTVITSLKSQKEVAIKLLKLQLGIDFKQEVLLKDSLAGIVTQGNFQFLSSSEFNIENNIDFELMKTQEGLMALSYKREKSKFLPTISAFYRHQELLKTPVLNFNPKDVGGISVSFPIFTSGQRISKVGQARLDFEKSTLNKENVGQGLVLDFEKARNDYQTAFSNFSTNKESMELGKKIYDKTMIKYRSGVSSSLELTQNQNQYLTAESNYYNSVLTLLSAKAKLERILTKSNDQIK